MTFVDDQSKPVDFQERAGFVGCGQCITKVNISLGIVRLSLELILKRSVFPFIRETLVRSDDNTEHSKEGRRRQFLRAGLVNEDEREVRLLDSALD
jgi:hypothetical protein